MDDSLLHDEKRFNERFFTIMNDPALRRVVEQFGTDPFRRSSVVECFDAVLQANSFKGQRCVEIGTWKGLTAIVLARYFDEVVSIDIHPNEEKHRIAEFLGVTNVRFIDVKDNAEKAEVIKALEFDAAYVDGDHARDTESDFSLVERCGHVLMHEHWNPQPAVINLFASLRNHGIVTLQGKFAIWKS